MPKVPIVIKPLPDQEELSQSLQLSRQLLYKKLKKVEEEVREIVEKVMEEGRGSSLLYQKI